MSTEWWVCDCCGDVAPPYGPYGPYGPRDDGSPYSGYYGQELSGCGCCGAESIVVSFGAAKEYVRQPRHFVFSCSPCASPLFSWSSLVGQSMTLDLCDVDGDDSGECPSLVKVFVGCKTYPITCWSIERTAAGDCPDLSGTVTFTLTVTCRKFETGDRCVSLHGGVPRVNRGPGNCGNPLGCGFYSSYGCSADPFNSPADYQNQSGSLVDGYLVGKGKNCNGTVQVSATPNPGAGIDAGIYQATVIF